MARQEDTVMIDDKQYMFTQLGPREATKVYLWLVGLVGGLVGSGIAAVAKGKGSGSILDADVDFDKLGGALDRAFNTLDSDRTMQQLDVLLSSVLFSGQRMNLDSLNFQGRMLHMTKVTRKAVEVNFSDFLEGFAGASGHLKRMMAIVQNRATSTGSSGAQS